MLKNDEFRKEHNPLFSYNKNAIEKLNNGMDLIFSLLITANDWAMSFYLLVNDLEIYLFILSDQ